MTAPPCYEPAETSSSGVRLMKAVLCQRFGTPDDLVLADIPDPVAGAGEVVARVAGLGPDIFSTPIISRENHNKTPLPFSPRAPCARRGATPRAGWHAWEGVHRSPSRAPA